MSNIEYAGLTINWIVKCGSGIAWIFLLNFHFMKHEMATMNFLFAVIYRFPYLIDRDAKIQ